MSALRRRLGLLLLPLVAIVAVWPIGRMVHDGWELVQLTGQVPQAPPRGFDWVHWVADEGRIVAGYVFPNGPAARAGIRPGDVFYLLDFQQFFNLEDLKQAIDGQPPGSVHTYALFRDGNYLEARVRFTRYPTFLYPLSPTLWQFSLWGFALGSFVHVLALLLLFPLARRSRRARFSLLLICVSGLWFFSNLGRLLLITFLGPPLPGGMQDRVFQLLTFTGLVGWIGFPALLLRQIVHDLRLNRPVLYHRICYLPPLILALAMVLTTFHPSLLPFSVEALIAPILFYVCCYVALAAGLTLLLRSGRSTPSESWNRSGSWLTLGFSVLLGLSVLDVVPLLGLVTDSMVGWLIVSVQLLSVAPIGLVSLATLKLGKVDLVLERTLVYSTVLGAIFLAFVGGMSLMEPLLQRINAPWQVVAGLYVVVLLVLFERFARWLRRELPAFFSTERQRTRQMLSRLQEQLRQMFSLEELAQRTVEVVGAAFQARSVRLFFRPTESTPWISAAYHPEPPYLTERIVETIWPHFRQKSAIWACNPELNEHRLPGELHALLESRNVALVIPITGEQRPLGLLILGDKRNRHEFYNLEDLDLLRMLSSQLALAIERLHLLERERALIRQNAEAQLVALRAQINPHFLFNALNTIAALINERPEEAEAVVEHLAAIFRHTLNTGGRSFVTLEEELRLVSHYLEIERARFGGKLQVSIDLPATLQSFPVPAFAVQTLAENAVKHGLEKLRASGTIQIQVQRLENGLVEILVADTGVGIPALWEQNGQATEGPLPFFGLGLRNVMARLEQLYGRRDLLRFESAPGQGTRVRLLLPTPQTEPASSANLNP
ncbi:histidine kinase [Rhodothermus profundi]|uniref:PDZ domain-containing protein n=1 Tax=Rhodothermus profundi TaxID=633813 RepID=A0A1M6PV42_9BACT|nr:histidine kinase [Rhodothermus profundi]SHK11720.1 PDZ domain-containing protein [Rhodothermus profundi]